MSNRITKYTAEKAANKLRDFYFNEKIDATKKSLDDFINALVDKYVAKPVLDMFDENPNLFEKKNTISFYNDNEQSYWARTKYLNMNPLRALPNKPLSINDDDWAVLKEKIKELDNIRDKARKYSSEVTDALRILGTYAKISENFPEALPYIDFSSIGVSPSITKSLDELRHPKI